MSNLMTDIGERFEYVKTIIHNTIELKKLDAAEDATEIMGNLLVSFIALFLIMILLTIGIVACGILLFHLTESYVISLSVLSAFVLLLLIILIIKKESLVIRPITRFLLSKFLKKYR